MKKLLGTLIAFLLVTQYAIGKDYGIMSIDNKYVSSYALDDSDYEDCINCKITNISPYKILQSGDGIGDLHILKIGKKTEWHIALSTYPTEIKDKFIDESGNLHLKIRYNTNKIAHKSRNSYRPDYIITTNEIIITPYGLVSDIKGVEFKYPRDLRIMSVFHIKDSRYLIAEESTYSRSFLEMKYPIYLFKFNEDNSLKMIDTIFSSKNVGCDYVPVDVYGKTAYIYFPNRNPIIVENDKLKFKTLGDKLAHIYYSITNHNAKKQIEKDDLSEKILYRVLGAYKYPLHKVSGSISKKIQDKQNNTYLIILHMAIGTKENLTVVKISANNFVEWAKSIEHKNRETVTIQNLENNNIKWLENLEIPKYTHVIDRR